MKVLHVCTDFWPSTGGIQLFVLELAKRSRTVGIEPAVFCCNRAKGHPGQLPRQDRVDGVPVTRAPFLDLRFYKPTSFLKSNLRSFDLIHVHGVGAQLDYLALSRWFHKKPLILSTHGAIFHTDSLRTLKQYYFHKFQPFILARTDLVAACSQSDAALFSKVARNVKLVENAVDVDGLLALPITNKCGNRCLYVGRLAPNKAIPALLEAFGYAMRHGAAFTLHLVGPDSSHHERTYRAMAEQLGIAERVRFLGAVAPSRLSEEYERADLFVSASRYEGFGMSAIEARAAGCRMLLQDNDAFAHLFARDSQATLTDFGRVDVAGSALAELLRAGGNGENGRSEMKRYSWERKIHEWLAVYAEVAATSSG